jgi:hypothetical protein
VVETPEDVDKEKNDDEETAKAEEAPVEPPLKSS